MDLSDWELRYSHLRAARDADQAERRAMLSGAASIEDSAFDERISGEVDDEAVQFGGDTPEWDKREAASERIVGAALEQIEYRVASLGSGYPFLIDGGGLKYRGSATGVYEICLATSLSPTAKVSSLPKPTVVFEWIARDILKLYLGPGSMGFRTGWPSHRLERRERGPARLFSQLHGLCNEFAWHPKSYLPTNPKPRDLKDAGLDVVVWKPFGDRRACSMFVLGQCACGWTDWENKFGDLCLKRLAAWFEGPTFAEPMRCFFVPFNIPNDAHLKHVAEFAGVPIDRTRIVMLAEENADSVASVKKNALVDYRKMAFAIAETHEVAN
ncbi:MAG: hypothetical protein U1F98_14710 [Verrucomicrobiota bacterium]